MSADPHQSNSENTSQDGPQRSRILVVDDDKSTRRLVQKILNNAGYEFEGFPSAEAALLYLEDSTVDIVLSDIMLDGMDGIEFCAQIRSQTRHEDVPIICFTGISDVESLNRAYKAGASDYIMKPLRRVELLNRIDHHLEVYRRKKTAKDSIQRLNSESESKTKFLGVASHDLRNPLVSIRGISQYLGSEKFGPLNDGQHELVQTIVDASENMLLLVEDLLDVSLLETGQMRIQPERQSLEPIVDQAVILHSVSASKKHIQLSKETKTDDCEACFDKKLMSRVLDNLISNAVKFSPSNTKIKIAIESDSDALHFYVEDEGPGIPENEFDKLFKEFGRTSNQPTAGESTSGIGLFVTNRIIQRHGGTISVENRSPKGTRFTVTLNRIIAHV
ncbi:MAG: two-component system sensor histidine kinase/response regulator [Candidatus Pelagisphaera sp.]|jgi:two-component system sensor histidine kinase/response regulator